MATLDVGSLFADFSNTLSLLAGQQDEALKNVQQLQTESGILASRGTDARGFTALQVQTEGLAKLEAQNYIQDYLENIDYRGQMAEYAQAHRAASAQELVLRQKLSQDASVSIFDDPLQAVMNAFTIPWTQQALEAKASEVKSITSNMDDLNRLATNAAQATLATARTVTEASIKDAVDATAANIQRLQQEYDTKAMLTNADRVKAAMGATKDQLDMQLRAEDITEKRKMRELQERVMTAQFGKISDEAKAAQFDLQLIRAGAKSLGGEGWTEEMYLNRKLAGDPVVNVLRERGWQLMFGSAADNSVLPLGRDVAETKDFEQRFPNLLTHVTDDTQRIRALRDAAYEEMLTAHKDDPKKARAFMQEAFERKLEEKQTWTPGDDSNPFRPASWKTISEQEQVKNDPLWQKYVAPTITRDNEFRTMDPNELAKILVTAMKKDKISAMDVRSLMSMAVNSSMVLTNNTNQVEFFTSGWKQTKLITPTQEWWRPDSRTAFIPGVGPGVGLAANTYNLVNPAYPKKVNWANDAEVANFISIAFSRFTL